MLFESAYDDFKIYVQNRHKKQGFITLTTDFKNHVLPYFIGRDVSTLTTEDVMKWQTDLLKFNYANKYYAKIYYSFKYFIDYCILCNYQEENIVSSVGPFPKKIEVKTYTTYSLFQFFRFRRYIDDFVIRQFCTFIYFYGSRPGETMAFQFIDKKWWYVRVIHNLQRKGKRELDTPKNPSSVRAFKIGLIMCFRIWLLKLYYKKKYGKFSDDYFIFGGPKPLAPTTIDRYKKRAYEKAHLPSISQHELRHSYATRKIHKKVPIDIVSKSMGHAKVSTTLDIYVHNEKNTLNVFPH